MLAEGDGQDLLNHGLAGFFSLVDFSGFVFSLKGSTRGSVRVEETSGIVFLEGHVEERT
jgi:hypothetical protein